jgi:type II secretory pathway pseudopilin PulG
MEPTLSAGRRREAGFTLIDILFVIALIGVLASMAIPGLMRARGAAQATSALGTMRVVNSAQLTFAISCGLGFYSPDFTSLGNPPPNSVDGFLPPELSGGLTFNKSGYMFSMAGTPVGGAPATCNGMAGGTAASGYAIVADPSDPVVNSKYFGSNSDGVLYTDSASLATTMPETGPPPTGKVVQ